jgi:hypothetical protein
VASVLAPTVLPLRHVGADVTEGCVVMIPGFNHNIKHRGRVFHVQTEDSGPKNPHIITHLFVGGNIVSSRKTQYAELLGQDGYEAVVRKSMEEQHKQMLRDLIKGAFDNVELATAYHLDGPAPLNYTATSPTTNVMAGSAAFTGLPSQTGGSAESSLSTAPSPSPSSVLLPPTPVASTSVPSWAPATSGTPTLGAAIGTVRTIFGEDLISERSLDEVILSYLAENQPDSDGT